MFVSLCMQLRNQWNVLSSKSVWRNIHDIKSGMMLQVRENEVSLRKCPRAAVQSHTLEETLFHSHSTILFMMSCICNRHKQLIAAHQGEVARWMWWGFTCLCAVRNYVVWGTSTNTFNICATVSCQASAPTERDGSCPDVQLRLCVVRSFVCSFNKHLQFCTFRK